MHGAWVLVVSTILCMRMCIASRVACTTGAAVAIILLFLADILQLVSCRYKSNKTFSLRKSRNNPNCKAHAQNQYCVSRMDVMYGVLVVLLTAFHLSVCQRFPRLHSVGTFNTLMIRNSPGFQERKDKLIETVSHIPSLSGSCV